MDSGHITITPKICLTDRIELTPQLAIELMFLTTPDGEAMTIGLKNMGVILAGLITRIIVTGACLNLMGHTSIIIFMGY